MQKIEERLGKHVCPQHAYRTFMLDVIYGEANKVISVSSKTRSGGFTLIELMIVVAIVAILASIAYPSYRDSIIKGRRSVAKSALLDVASRQEQYYQNNKSYIADLKKLGYAASPLYLSKDGNSVAATDSSRIYEISVTAASATSFTVQAKPEGNQVHDSRCGRLTLGSSGVKGTDGSLSECW